MSQKKTVVSPYKRTSQTNSSYCGYLQMDKLTKNKPYQIYDMKHTTHEQYGEGELAFIYGQNNGRKTNRVQLPGKYLKMLSDESIKVWYNDIKKKKFPYLVYRETLPDKSYLISIYPETDQLLDFNKNWDDVPDLDISGESECSLDSSIESPDADATSKRKLDDDNEMSPVSKVAKKY